MENSPHTRYFSSPKMIWFRGIIRLQRGCSYCNNKTPRSCSRSFV